MQRVFPFLLAALAAAQTGLDPAKIDALAESIRQKAAAPGFAVAVVSGARSHAQGYGVRRLGGTEKVTARTIFATGSVSKSFTAMLAASLVDEGKLEWDRPVREYLPWFRLYDGHATDLMTVRDLLTHRSGLPRYDFLRFAVPLEREEIVRRLRWLPPTATIRERYQYNNLAFVAAGYLQGALSGSSWEELVERRIFEPLGMKDSTVRVADTVKRDDYARGAEREGAAWRQMEFYDYQRFGVGPNGAVNSTAEDMVRYLRFQMGDGTWEGRTILSAAQMAEMHRPQMVIDGNSFYALGWNVAWEGGRKLIYHGGSITGFRAWAGFDPEKDEGLAVLFNCGCDAEGAGRSLGAEIFGWPKREPPRSRENLRAAQPEPAAGPPSRPLRAYAGKYEHPAFGVAEVSEREGKLWLKFPAMEGALQHSRFDWFVDREGRALRFALNGRGEPASFEMRVDPVAPMAPFLRKP